jgi:hypothetical protein
MSTDDTSTVQRGLLREHGPEWKTLRGGLQVRHAGASPDGLHLEWRDWSCPVVGHTGGTARRAPRYKTVEWDDGKAYCLFPGCLRNSFDPVPRGECCCDTYEPCYGECCGPGECSCSSRDEEGEAFWRAHVATCPDCRALVARTGEDMRVEPVMVAPSFDLPAAMEKLDVLTVAPAGVVRKELLAAYRAGLSAGQLAYMKVINGSRRRMSELMVEAAAEVQGLGRAG